MTIPKITKAHVEIASTLTCIDPSTCTSGWIVGICNKAIEIALAEQQESVSKDELELLESTDMFTQESRGMETRKLYTHPAPFTPISADMVTDEIVNEYLTFMGKASYLSHPDVTYQGTVNHDSPEKWYLRFSKAAFAAAVNAWGAKQ